MKGAWRGVFAIPCAVFNGDGTLELAQLERQLRFCLDAGAHGVAVPLLASEFFTLSDAERRTMLEVTVGTVAGAVPVIAGVSGVSTQHAVELAQHARRVGADGVVAMPPYITRVDADETVRYFTAIAAACRGDVPVMAQNADPPQPLGFPIETPLLARICREVPSVRYVKEERTPGPYFLSQDVKGLEDLVDGVFGGRAGLYFLDELRRGGAGTMVAPEVVDLLVRVYNLFATGETEQASRLHERLLSAIAKEVLLGPSFAKRLLRLRGVIQHVGIRSGAERWDAYEEARLVEIWEALEPLTRQTAGQAV